MDFLNRSFHMVDRHPDKTKPMDQSSMGQPTYRELSSMSRRIRAKLKKAGEMSSGVALTKGKLWRSHSPPKMRIRHPEASR